MSSDPRGPESGVVARIQRQRRAMAESGPRRQRRDGDFARVTLPDTDSDALRDLLVDEQARAVIEVGLAYGSSALAIAEALATVDEASKTAPGADETAPPVQIAIDAYQASAYDNVGRAALSDAGLGDRILIETDQSQLVLPRLVDEGVTVDAAFVDGSHIFHNVFVDLYYLAILVRPGGLVVLDDWSWPSVQTAARYFVLNTGWHPQHLPVETRLKAFRLPDPRIEPHFDDFVPFGTAT